MHVYGGMSMVLHSIGDMTFTEYVYAWVCAYPSLDVYYHMHYIEQAYKELYKEEIV